VTSRPSHPGAGLTSRPSRPGWRAKAKAARAAVAVVWAASPLLVTGIAVICLVAGLITPATAWLQRDVLDMVVGGAASHRGIGASGVLIVVLALGVAGVAAAVMPQAQQYLQATLRRGVGLVVTDRSYRAVASWPGIGRFESPAFADRLQLAGQLAQATASSLVTSALGGIQALVTASTLLITLIVINPLLAAITAGVEALAIVANLANARSQAQLQLENSTRARRQNSFGVLLSDAVSAKEVRLFGLGGFLLGRLLAELKAANAAERALGRRLLWIESGLALVSSAVIAGGLVWTVSQVVAGNLPVGDVSLFVLAAMGMQGSMNQVAGAVGGVAQSVTLFTAYTDVVSAGADLPVAEHPVPVPPLRHGIAIENVWFRYDESHPWVLRGVTMFIPAGSHVGLVGRNGSGKSTLVKLLCRLYDPVRGSISWDGIDIRELDPAALRQQIGGVFQDFMTYELTAAENIGVGDLGLIGDRDELRRAAELAGIHDDIARLPLGYDTMLSRVFQPAARKNGLDVGVTLSGGQRQRLALARALMRIGRSLLIVDEPMSNLDAEAEHAVNKQLAQAQAGHTCVLISHRLAAVRDSDQIVVLSDGVVAERGTHAELLDHDGQYAYLFRLQAEGYGDVGAVAPVKASS